MPSREKLHTIYRIGGTYFLPNLPVLAEISQRHSGEILTIKINDKAPQPVFKYSNLNTWQREQNV